MIDQSKARIFLAAQRQLKELPGSQSYDSFCEGSAFGALRAIKDETLAPSASSIINFTEYCQVIIIPLVADIRYITKTHKDILSVGELGIFHLIPDEELIIVNSNTDELANYLQLHMRNIYSDVGFNNISFDVATGKNSLVHIFSDHISNLFIGRFDGRKETQHPIGEGYGAFVMVLDGAFEVNHRLLETSDALALENTSALDIEALSSDAVILAITLAI